MTLCKTVGITVLAVMLSGVGSATAQGLVGEAMLRKEGATVVNFAPVGAGVGLNDLYTEGNTHTGGCAWIDYNGDYWPDLFITNGSGFDHLLYRNNGDGTFTDVSALVAKPDILLEDAGVLFGDLENDGDEDIVVLVDSSEFSIPGPNPDEGGPNLCYVNQGNGTFVEAAGSTGIVDPRGWRTITGGIADYDRDGFLDLFAAHWQFNSEPDDLYADYDRMLHNNGDGSFSDATDSTRVNGYGRDALVCHWFDADLDGWPDLWLGNAGEPSLVMEPENNDIFYRNLNDGTFFCDGTGDPHILGDDAKAAMGIDTADVDHDGDFDIYITDVFPGGPEPFGNVLYLNNGDGTFADNSADVAGVQAFSSWPCIFADFDLDGWEDLYVGTGSAGFKDYLYINDQDGTFTDLDLPLFDNVEARGGAAADYDGDGDVDFFVWAYGMDSILYRNDTTTPRHWLEVKLLGRTSNASAIGAIVRVDTGSEILLRRVSGGDSAHSQAELIQHFGVASAAQVDLQIDWPSGVTQFIERVGVDQLVFIDELAGRLTEQAVNSAAQYDVSDETLLVAVSTSFGGRSSLSAVGYGPMPYNVEQLGHKDVFTGIASAPVDVTVTSDSGESWVLPVVSVP